MRTVLAVLAATALASGCLAPGDRSRGPGRAEPVANSPASTTGAAFALAPASPRDVVRDGGQYWLVWAHGNETRDGPRLACMRAFDHELDLATGRLTYNADEHAIDRASVRVVVAFDHYRPEGCVAALDLGVDPAGSATRAMGGFGPLSIEVRDDGTVIAAGRDVPLGHAAVFTYDGRDPEDGVAARGAFRVENLGAWDRSRIEAVG